MNTTVPRHVLFLVENASVPLDRRVWKEALAVRDMGHRVTIVCPRGHHTDTEKNISLEGIAIHRYPHGVVGTGTIAYFIEYVNALFWTSWLLLRINLSRRVDIYHVANPPDIFFMILFWYRLFGARYVFDIHDLFVNTFESKFMGDSSLIKRSLVHVLRVLERVNIACTDYVIVTNNSYREYIRRKYRVPDTKLAVVRNAPPLDNRASIGPDPSLKHGRTYLLTYFGVMGEDDGVDVVLKAMHYLITHKKFDDFHCALIGPTEVDLSPAIHSLQKLHATLHLESHVGFTGFLPWTKVHQYLNTADLGLSPDLFTAQNNLSTMIKMMEYMSHGIPIVSFNLKENRYSGGDAAVYCDTFEVEEFAEKIFMLLHDGDRRRRMREAGLERYQTQFNWSVSRDILQSVYATIR